MDLVIIRYECVLYSVELIWMVKHGSKVIFVVNQHVFLPVGIFTEMAWVSPIVGNAQF